MQALREILAMRPFTVRVLGIIILVVGLTMVADGMLIGLLNYLFPMPSPTPLQTVAKVFLGVFIATCGLVLIRWNANTRLGWVMLVLICATTLLTALTIG